MLLQRPHNGGRVRVRAAPLARLSPYRIHRADAPRQRIDVVQIAHDALLMGDGDAEAGQGQIFGQLEKVPQLRAAHQQRHVHRVNPQ